MTRLSHLRKPIMPKKNSISIPHELMPYFLAIFPRSKNHIWITHVYYALIIPYVDKLIEKIEYSGKSEYEKLLLIKSYFTHKAGEVHTEARQKVFSLYLGMNSLDKITWEFENSFFKAMRQNEMDVPLNAFLPINFSKHLKSILKIQVLISLRKRLFSLSDKSKDNQAITSYLQWINREIQTRTIDVSNKGQSLDEGSPYQPNFIIYFFNGAARLWVFVQLEYLKINEVMKNFQDGVNSLNVNEISFYVIALSLPLSALKFIIDLFFIALMPYRLLRTVVNELSKYLLIVIDDLRLKYYPYSIKEKNWLILNFFIQLSIYLALTISFGLPILPLPHAFVPELLFAYFPLIGLGYLGATVVFALMNSIYHCAFKGDNKVVTSNKLIKSEPFPVNKHIPHQQQYQPQFKLFCKHQEGCKPKVTALDDNALDKKRINKKAPGNV